MNLVTVHVHDLDYHDYSCKCSQTKTRERALLWHCSIFRQSSHRLIFNCQYVIQSDNSFSIKLCQSLVAYSDTDSNESLVCLHSLTFFSLQVNTSDSTSSGSSGSRSGSSSSSSESSESHKKPKSLAADVENLKGGQRNGKEHPKQNVHNSVDKSNPETACPLEPDNNNDTPDPKTACPPEPDDNNDTSDPETACPPEPENNDTPDPETACPPEPENNECVPPDDVYGECLLLERLMRAKEMESLSCPGGDKVQMHSKIAFTMLQNFIIV